MGRPGLGEGVGRGGGDRVPARFSRTRRIGSSRKGRKEEGVSPVRLLVDRTGLRRVELGSYVPGGASEARPESDLLK